MFDSHVLHFILICRILQNWLIYLHAGYWHPYQHHFYLSLLILLLYRYVCISAFNIFLNYLLNELNTLYLQVLTLPTLYAFHDLHIILKKLFLFPFTRKYIYVWSPVGMSYRAPIKAHAQKSSQFSFPPLFSSSTSICKQKVKPVPIGLGSSPFRGWRYRSLSISRSRRKFDYLISFIHECDRGAISDLMGRCSSKQPFVVVGTCSPLFLRCVRFLPFCPYLLVAI